LTHCPADYFLLLVTGFSQLFVLPLPINTVSLPLLVLLVSAFGGCVRPPEEDANRILFSIWGSVQQVRAEQEIIRAFREENPDIQVDLMVIGSRYPDKIQAMMVGNVAPDVMMIEMRLYDEWAARGVLVDLTEEFNDLQTENTFLPIPLKAFARDGGVFALPVNCHGLVTFYNSDALRQAGVEIPAEGLSWEYLLEVGPLLSRRAGNPNAPTDYAMMLPPPITIFWQHGVQIFDDLFDPQEVTVNTPEAVAAVKTIRRLLDSGFAVPPQVEADEGTFQLFRDGRVAFYFNGRWMTPEFDGRTAFDWDVVPYPAGPVSNITMHGGTALGVWKNSRRQEAARRFVNFYTSRAGAEIAMKHQRLVPVFKESAYGEEFLSLRPPESMHYFSDTMLEGSSTTFLYAPGSQQVMHIIQNRMQQAMSDRSRSAEEIVTGLEQDLRRWLNRSRIHSDA